VRMGFCMTCCASAHLRVFPGFGFFRTFAGFDVNFRIVGFSGVFAERGVDESPAPETPETTRNAHLLILRTVSGIRPVSIPSLRSRRISKSPGNDFASARISAS
jgi:hypothetical protein